MENRKRWTVVALLFGTHVITFVIRVALGVAAPTLMSLYHISPGTMGYILSGYSWTYTVSVPLAGVVVDRLGPYLVMGLGSLIWGASTLALPLIPSPVFFFLMRALFGLGHSMMIPGGASGVRQWIPLKQRATAVGLIFCGGTVGLAIGSPAAAFLLDLASWQVVFFTFGGVSLGFSALWFLLYPRERAESPESASGPVRPSRGVPGFRLLRYRATWALVLGQMGYLYAYFFFMTWLPGYLIMERGMSVLRTGFVASLPFLMGMLGTVGGGFLGDFLIRAGVRPIVSRKAIIGTGLILATIMVVTAAFTAQTWLAVLFLMLCMGCLRMTTASSNAIPIDLAPPGEVASLASIQSVGGNIGGLIAPIATGLIVEATGSFVGALVAAGGMALMGACSYLFLLGSLEAFPSRK